MKCTHCKAVLRTGAFKRVGWESYCSKSCAVEAGIIPKPIKKKLSRKSSGPRLVGNPRTPCGPTEGIYDAI